MRGFNESPPISGPDTTLPHICILMATLNGVAHLAEQLGSISAQHHTNWSLWISDDGSTDATREIATAFQRAHPDHRIRLLDGPQRGSAANFLSLLTHLDLPRDAHVAFSDQDDIWMAHRLSRALDCLGEANHAQVYASRTILADANGTPIRPSRRNRRQPGFGNALVQNILAGNTIVLNPQAAAILRRCTPAALEGPGVPFHDWWIYQVMTGAGAEVILDDVPGLYYRQHAGNLMGANRGFRHGLARLAMIRERQYAGWIDRNLSALDAVSDEFTPENRELLNRFIECRKTGAGLRQIGIRRQTGLGDLMLRMTARLGRL